MSIKSWFSKLTERGGAKYAIAEQFLFGEGKQGGILTPDGSHINKLDYQLTNSTTAQKEVLDKFGIVPKKYTEIYNDIKKQRLKHSTVIDILTDKNGYVTQQVEKIKGPKSLNSFLKNKLINRILIAPKLFSKYKSALKMASWAKYIANITSNDAKFLYCAAKPLRGLLYKQKKHVLTNYLAICSGSLHDDNSENFKKIKSNAEKFKKSVLDFLNKKRTLEETIELMSNNNTLELFEKNISDYNAKIWLPLLRLDIFYYLMGEILTKYKEYFKDKEIPDLNNLSEYKLDPSKTYYENASLLFQDIEKMEATDQNDIANTINNDLIDVKNEEEAAKKIQAFFRGSKKTRENVKSLLNKIKKSKNIKEISSISKEIKGKVNENENVDKKGKEEAIRAIEEIKKIEEKTIKDTQK